MPNRKNPRFEVLPGKADNTWDIYDNLNRNYVLGQSFNVRSSAESTAKQMNKKER